MICSRCLGTGEYMVDDNGNLSPIGKMFKCKKCKGRGFI